MSGQNPMPSSAGTPITPARDRAHAPLGCRRVLTWAALAALIYALALPWVLRPWFPAATTLPRSELRYGPMEDTDLLLNAWILAWIAHAAVAEPARLFDGNAFHPATNVISGSENMLQHVPLTAPLAALGGDAIEIIAAVVAESFVVAGLGMFLYVLWHTGRFVPALVAGAVFTLAPWRVQNVPHPQYLATGFLPLALLAVDIWIENGRWRALVGLAVAFALQTAACLYLGYFAGLAIPSYALARALGTRGRRARALAGPLLGLALGGLLVLPLALPYLAARQAGVIPPWEIASWGDWSWKPWWYLGRPFLQRAGPVVLAIVAGDLLARAWVRRRAAPTRLERWPAERALWMMAAGAAWLSAGPHPELPGGLALPTPYPLLQALVPGFAELRGPGRLYIVVLAALAALAGFAVARWQERLEPSRPRRAVLATAAVLLCAATAAPHPAPLLDVALRPGASPLHDWLARHGEHAPVLELPAPTTDHDVRGNLASARAMFESTRGFWPLLNGMTGHPPVTARFVNAIVRRLPDPTALQMLVNTHDVRWLVVHEETLLDHERAAWAGAPPPGLALRQRFDGTSLYELTLAPEPDLRDHLRRAATGAGGAPATALPAAAGHARAARTDASAVPTASLPAGNSGAAPSSNTTRAREELDVLPPAGNSGAVSSSNTPLADGALDDFPPAGNSGAMPRAARLRPLDAPPPEPLAAACRAARIDAAAVPAVIAMAPLPLALPVTFSNLSTCLWPGLAIRPAGLVGFTYRWTDPHGQAYLYPPAAFSPLLADVPAGATLSDSMMVVPPAGDEGAWTLDVDLVQWGVPTPLASVRRKVELRAFR